MVSVALLTSIAHGKQQNIVLIGHVHILIAVKTWLPVKFTIRIGEISCALYHRQLNEKLRDNVSFFCPYQMFKHGENS